jgi:CheY-like chemotaxis protein
MGTGQRPRVLLVEDDADNCEALGTLLRHVGYVVVCARTGHEALAAFHAFARPSVVILDLLLPDMSGYELYADLRANALARQIPVVIYTGVSNPDALPGAFALVRKGESPDHLLAMIAAACAGCADIA